jgi:hypothetical protein
MYDLIFYKHARDASNVNMIDFFYFYISFFLHFLIYCNGLSLTQHNTHLRRVVLYINGLDMIEEPLKIVIQDHTDTGVTLRLSLIHITNPKLYCKKWGKDKCHNFYIFLDKTVFEGVMACHKYPYLSTKCFFSFPL